MPPASYSYIFETQPGTTRTFLVFTWRTFRRTLYFSYCYRFCDTHIYIYRYNTVITDKYNTTIELHNISWQGHGRRPPALGARRGDEAPAGRPARHPLRGWRSAQGSYPIDLDVLVVTHRGARAKPAVALAELSAGRAGRGDRVDRAYELDGARGGRGRARARGGAQRLVSGGGGAALLVGLVGLFPYEAGAEEHEEERREEGRRSHQAPEQLGPG